MNKKYFFLVSILIYIIFFSNLSLATDYDNHWASITINNLIDKGIIQGDGYGNINPDDDLTRAEFVKMINKVMNYSELTGKQFKDVYDNDWYAKEFLIAKNIGYIQGDENGNVNPNNNITRAEASVVLSRVLLITSDNKLLFEDESEIPKWAYESISGLVEEKILKGYIENTFGANNNITRAEGMTLISRLIEFKEKNDKYIVVKTKDIYGNNITFNVRKERDKYILENENIRIYTIDLEDNNEFDYQFNNKQYLYSLDNLWDGKLNIGENIYQDRLAKMAVTTYYNAIRIDNFYKNILKDNNNNKYNICLIINNDNYSNITSTYTEHNTILLGNYSESNNCMGILMDVLGHEMTHIVGENIHSLKYSGESGTLEEAYSDILAELIEMYYQENVDTKWVIGNKKDYVIRSFEDPNSYYDPCIVNDKYYNDKFLDPHLNMTILTHVAYLMYNNGINDEIKLAKLWYNSMYYLKPTSGFEECRDAILEVAKDMNMTQNEIYIIENSFDTVGITD